MCGIRWINRRSLAVTITRSFGTPAGSYGSRKTKGGHAANLGPIPGPSKRYVVVGEGLSSTRHALKHAIRLPCEADQKQTARSNEATVSELSGAPVRKAPDDDALAWELAAAAQPYLIRCDADSIFIAIGVGETFTAIDALLTVMARERITLSRDLVATVASWLHCYRGQDTEPRLRHLLAEINRYSPHEMSSAFMQRSGVAPTAGHDKTVCRIVRSDKQGHEIPDRGPLEVTGA